MRAQRIVMVGIGNLGAYILDLLLRTRGQHTFLIGGRNIDALQQRVNLSLFTAMQLGHTPDVAVTYLDLWNIDQTATILSRFQPDIIVCAATLQRTEATNALPQAIVQRLAPVQWGPRLPLHLCLIYKLMQAVKQVGRPVIVLNAVYPDVVGPILNSVGLAPTTGIGDLANNVPALRQALALKLDMPVTHVDVRLIMAHYVSYWMSRKWIGDAPFHFTALVNGQEWTSPLDLKAIFGLLPTKFKRAGGATGLLMTAASAALVFDGIVNNTGVITHAPGPNGLPGGYPVRVDAQGVKVVLPQGLSQDIAVQINERGLLLDGIERIESDGTVYFADENMAILKEILGYECKRMPLAEVEDRAHELQARYSALRENTAFKSSR